MRPGGPRRCPSAPPFYLSPVHPGKLGAFSAEPLRWDVAVAVPEAQGAPRRVRTAGGQGQMSLVLTAGPRPARSLQAASRNNPAQHLLTPLPRLRLKGIRVLCHLSSVSF